jgi:hypothetical protein
MSVLNEVLEKLFSFFARAKNEKSLSGSHVVRVDEVREQPATSN